MLLAVFTFPDQENATGVTPFFNMMLPNLAVSPDMTTAYAFLARS